MTEEVKKDYIIIQNTAGETVFKINDQGIFVNESLEVSEQAQLVIDKLGNYIINGVKQVLEPEMNRLRANCWQLMEERNALMAQLQALQQTQRLDS